MCKFNNYVMVKMCQLKVTDPKYIKKQTKIKLNSNHASKFIIPNLVSSHLLHFSTWRLNSPQTNTLTIFLLCYYGCEGLFLKEGIEDVLKQHVKGNI